MASSSKSAPSAKKTIEDISLFTNNVDSVISLLKTHKTKFSLSLQKSLMKREKEMENVIKSERLIRKQNKQLKSEKAALLKSKTECEQKLIEKNKLIGKLTTNLEEQRGTIESSEASLTLHIAQTEKLKTELDSLKNAKPEGKAVNGYLLEIAHLKAMLLSKSNELDDAQSSAENKIKCLENQVQTLQSQINSDLRIDHYKNLASHYLIAKKEVEIENVELRSAVKTLEAILQDALTNNI